MPNKIEALLAELKPCECGSNDISIHKAFDCYCISCNACISMSDKSKYPEISVANWNDNNKSSNIKRSDLEYIIAGLNDGADVRIYSKKHKKRIKILSYEITNSYGVNIIIE